MKILDIEGIVENPGQIEFGNIIPFSIIESRFGVSDVLFGPKHLSERNPSITKNKIFLIIFF